MLIILNHMVQGSCITVTFIAVNNVLTNLYHHEYSKCPLLVQMQAWICRATGHAVASSVTLYSTATHTSVRRCLKSFS